MYVFEGQFITCVYERVWCVDKIKRNMITIICGTHREDSNSEKITKLYAEFLEKRGEEVQVLMLNQLPENFLFEDTFNDGSETFNQIVEKYISSADKFVFVIPEYNGSYPGVLKAFIDAVHPKEFWDKRACLVGVSTGQAGALRPMDHFTDVLHHLKVEVLSDKPKLSVIHQYLKEDGELTNELYRKRMNDQIEKFVRF